MIMSMHWHSFGRYRLCYMSCDGLRCECLVMFDVSFSLIFCFSVCVDIAIVVSGVGQCLVSFSMTLALFGPKFYYVFDGRANDASMVITSLSKHSTDGTGTTKGDSSKKGAQPSRNELFNRYLKLESQIQAIDDIINKGGSMEQIMTARRRHTSKDVQQGRPI